MQLFSPKKHGDDTRKRITAGQNNLPTKWNAGCWNVAKNMIIIIIINNNVKRNCVQQSVHYTGTSHVSRKRCLPGRRKVCSVLKKKKKNNSNQYSALSDAFPSYAGSSIPLISYFSPVLYQVVHWYRITRDFLRRLWT